MSKSKKRKHQEDESSSSPETSDEDESARKRAKKIRKHKSKKSKKKKEVKKHKKLKKHKKSKKKERGSEELCGPLPVTNTSEKDVEIRRQLKPMTKEEWEKQQSVIRRVPDPETGRMRLIKGDGEVLEEIVSKEQHRQINRKATLGDGMYFQTQLGVLKK